MKSILRLKISCLFVLALSINNYCAKEQIVQVINPNPGETSPFTAGITTTNGLRIEVLAMVIFRFWIITKKTLALWK